MLATPRRRGVALAVLAMAVLAGWLVARDDEEPRRSPGAAGFEVALQDNAVFLHRYYYDLERAYAQARELGASWLRITLLWSRTAPTRSGHDWREPDRAVDAALRHGMGVQLNLTGPAPAWATGDGRVGVVRPDVRGFEDFVRAAAERYRGRVARYSIWNEPNYETWLAPRRTAAAQYRRLYVAGERAIARADPEARVLIGETAGPAQRGRVIPALRFLREVACRDRRGRPTAPCEPLRADGYAHHPYDFRHPPDHRPGGRDDVAIGSLDRLEAELDSLAASGALRSREGRPLDVYLTEFGYLRRTERRLPDALRARYLRRAFEIARARHPRVRQLLQYLLVSPPPDFPGGRFDTSVVSGGGEELAPFRALAEWSRANLP